MEIFYESLLDSPEKQMHDICRFLTCEFVPAMTELSKPSENLGDTKGQTKIVKDNKDKYRGELSPVEIKRLEKVKCNKLVTNWETTFW